MYNPAGELPAGWNVFAGPADVLLAIAGGSEAYNVVGESIAGLWAPTGHAHPFNDGGHVHATRGHVLTTAQMPSHTHNWWWAKDAAPGTGRDRAYVSDLGNGQGVTRTSGEDNAHDHGATYSTAASGTTDSISEPSTDRPKAAVGLLISRN
jgi:hypothetical protein